MAQVNSIAKSLWNTLSAFQDKSSGNLIKSADWDEISAAILLTQVTEKDGASLRMGSGVPSSSLGADGDWYFDKTSTTIYRKSSGSWVTFTSSGAAGTGAIWAEANLAGLQALGSGDGLTAGDIGVARDTDLLYRCASVTGASTSTWGPLYAPNIGVFRSLATANCTASAGETVRYNASGGTFTITAPASPKIGDRWGIKEGANSAALVAINGNGNLIEQPLIGQLATAFAWRKPYSAIEWQFDGVQWRCTSLSVRNSSQFDGSSTRTANFTALKGDRYRYDASGGGFTVTAPGSPAAGDRFAIKEVAGDATAITIDGNAAFIEDPIGGTTPSNFSFGVARASVEWEYDGSTWRVI